MWTVSDPGQEGEYEVEQILNRRTFRGRPFYLVRWQGHHSTSDSWEPVDLKNCPEKYEAAAARRPRLIRGADRAAPAGATPPAPPPPVAPAGWTIGPLGSPGTGSVVLYWWPDEGWQLGRVSRPAARRPLTHVVTYRRPTAAFTGTVDTLLDSASYGQRWMLLLPDRA